jgi:hypothetical protein
MHPSKTKRSEKRPKIKIVFNVCLLSIDALKLIKKTEKVK